MWSENPFDSYRVRVLTFKGVEHDTIMQRNLVMKGNSLRLNKRGRGSFLSIEL